MTKQQRRPAAQGGFGVFTGMSQDEWMLGMGITGDDYLTLEIQPAPAPMPEQLPGDGLADGGSVYTDEELDIINNPGRAMPGMVSRDQHLALRAALAGQDFHDAYHLAGMKDAVNCLLCFDYDERHGQHDPATGADQDGGCPWCGKDCPDAARPQGCWYPNCPDEPHA
jgi:hypothetical protein